MHLLTMIPVYSFFALLLGVALAPAFAFMQWAWKVSESLASPWVFLSLGASLAFSFLIYGFTLLFVLPLANWLLRSRLRAWRGPYYSLDTLKWFIHNGLTYLARYTFLEFVTPSPFNLLFYKMMGMKLGQHVVNNSTCISDPSLIEIGDKVTIGGSATLLAHYGQGGLLVIAPVKIGSRCTIGIKATIMGGVEIGEGAKILPHSVVLPNTRIPSGEIWGGVPAHKIQKSDLK